jgi:hypothetical protein
MVALRRDSGMVALRRDSGMVALRRDSGMVALRRDSGMSARGSSGQGLHRNAERVGRRGGRPALRIRQAGAPEPSIRWSRLPLRERALSAPIDRSRGSAEHD